LGMSRGELVEIPIHAVLQMEERGVTEFEVLEALRQAAWTLADRGRWQCRQDFDYGQERSGVYYRTKQVHPIFVEDGGRIVVVTVLAYYF